MRRDVLGDLGRVDVDVDELGARRELGELAGDAVVEAGADADDQVGLVHRVVRGAGAVHSEHPQPLVVRGREAAQAHHGAGDGELVREAELAQLLGGVGVDDAAPGVDHGPRGVRERLGGDPDLLDVALGRGLVAGQVDRLGAGLVLDVGAREVLGHVDQHRAGPARGGDVEGLVDVLGNVPRVGDHHRVLHDRQGDAADVGLLEAVRADQLGRTWPVMNTVGTESMIASAIGVTRLVAPGPEVAIATPTLPEALA